MSEPTLYDHLTEQIQLRDAALRKLVEQAKYAQALLEEDYQPGIIAGLPTAIAEAERLLQESEGE